jgi:hypothetical protein
MTIFNNYRARADSLAILKPYKMKNIITLLIGDFSKADIIPFGKQLAFLVLAIAFYSILS